MVRFLLKALSWTLPGSALCFILWVGLLTVDPWRDTNGLARTLPVQCNSMIFGTSRSAQGINPAILDGYNSDEQVWFNFSFNLGATPWCEAYSNAIIEKVNCSASVTSTSTFILSVDPWALDAVAGNDSSSWFQEPGYSWCEMSTLHYAINRTAPLDVLGRSSGLNFISVFPLAFKEALQFFGVNKGSSELNGLHKNGWLPNPSVLTAAQRRNSIHRKVNEYAQKPIGESWPGTANIRALSKTIEFLQELPNSPRILLLRLPVTESMLQLEDKWFPSFNQTLTDYADRYGLEFINGNGLCPGFSDDFFADGHHISREGALVFSECVGKSILSLR